MTRHQAEFHLQVAVADYLSGQLRRGNKAYPVPKPFPALIWGHPANEGRSPGEGAKYKKLGVRAGMPDLVLYWPPNGFGAIELKARTGTLSAPQKQFRKSFEGCGGKYAICRKVVEVRDTLIMWGLNCENFTVSEPGLRSWDQRVDDSLAWGAPS